MRIARLALFLLAALCTAQHIEFAPLPRFGIPAANPALDSHGNLALLAQNIEFGPGPIGSRPVLLLNQYGRDGSERLITETGLAGAGVTPAFLAIDPRDRIYVGVNQWNGPLLARFHADRTREVIELFAPGARLAAIAFAPNGDPVVAASADGPAIHLVRLDAATLEPVASRVLTDGPGQLHALAVDAGDAVHLAGAAPACAGCDWSSAVVVKLAPDLQTAIFSTVLGRAPSAATALHPAPGGGVYVAGYVSEESGDPTASTDGFVALLAPEGSRPLASAFLGGSLSESIDGLTLDSEGRVLVHGVTQSRNFAATGVFQTPCGPDRGSSYRGAFLARLDAGLQRVEKSIAAAGLDSLGLPAGPVRGPVFLLLGGAPALADFDRDEPSDVACVVNGASFTGLASVVPGQLVTLFGRGLGPDRLATFETGEPLPISVEGTEVFFNGVAAPVLAAVATQLNVVAPPNLEGWAWVEVKRHGELAFRRQLRLHENSPAPLLRVASGSAAIAFTGSPGVFHADAQNEDGSPNTAENPAAPGSLVTVFATGLGILDAPLPAGAFGDGTTRPVQSFIVRVPEERPAQVEAATIPGRTIAVLAVRFRVPAAARGVLQFSIEPSYSASAFTPKNFLYITSRD